MSNSKDKKNQPIPKQFKVTPGLTFKRIMANGDRKKKQK